MLLKILMLLCYSKGDISKGRKSVRYRISLISVIVVAVFYAGASFCFAEKIHTKDGRTIEGEIFNKIDDTIWYEVAVGSSKGKVGININTISQILNNDGTVSQYSPSYSESSKEDVVSEDDTIRYDELMEKFFGEEEEIIDEGRADEADTPHAWQEDKPSLPQEPKQPIIKTKPKATPGVSPIVSEEEPKAPVSTTVNIPWQPLSPGGKIGPAQFATMVPALGMTLLILLILGTLFSLYMGFCIYTIAKKTNAQRAWMGWIPFAQLFLMISIAQRPVRWKYILGGLILLTVIPFINILSSLGMGIMCIVLWCDIARIRNKPAWVGALMIVPLVNAIIPGYLAFSK